MLITIYDKDGNPKVELTPNDSSTQATEIQGDNVLTLSFTYYKHIDLDVDDYADFEEERYWLTEKYRPKQKSTKEWSYDIKLYGVESMIKRLLVIKTVDNEEEPVFTLTAPPREHVAMIVRCMNDGMGNITDWKVGQVNGTENIVIDYFGKYCDEALKEIAEKVGAEWWVEGQTVNICKCEHGEPVELGYNKGLLSIDPGTANNVKFYTRLYPVGSSRNIDPEKYGFTRLQLPGGQKYVEINADKYGRVDHFEQSAFEDIYPRRVGVISSVRSEVKTGEDGNPFTIYYFFDNSLPFDPNAYMIGGRVIRVSFQEGSELAGLGEEEDGTYFFEVNFNSTTREFEIITIWPYDNEIQLPGDKLVPKAGDKYILWNLRMPDEYYALAEEEFLTAVNKYNADHNLDISVYKAPTDHVWIEDNNVELSIGRRVRLVSEEYFPGFGFRDSRITKITRKVNLPSSMDIEISDALSRTTQEKMVDSITDVRSFAQSIGNSLSLPDIIRTWDKTLPTDNNLFSARRCRREFLNKNIQDRAKKKIIFDEGIDVGDSLPGVRGGLINGDGESELRSLLIRIFLASYGYSSGTLGHGFYLGSDPDAPEYSRLVVDKLYVRYKAIFDALEIRRLSQVGGVSILSPAGGTIISVEQAQTYLGSLALRDADGKELLGSDGAALTVVDPASLATVWRCRLRTDDGKQAVSNDFAVGDLVQCRTFNLASGQRFWWRRCVGVGADYIDLSMTDCAPGSDAPMAGDAAATLGNALDPERQHSISLAAYGPGAPSITLYQGISTYSTAGRDKTLISPYGSRFTGDFVVVADGSEVPLARFLADRISLGVRGTQADYSAESGTVESVDKIAVLSLRPEISSLKAGTRLRIAFDIDFDQDPWDEFEVYVDGGNSIFITGIEGNTNGWTEQTRHYEFDVELAEPVGNGSLLEIDGYGTGVQFRVSSLSVTRIPLEQELTETGIDIQSGKITLKGDTEIITNDGRRAALFRDGKIKAEYVWAGEVTADRVETRPVSDTAKARTVIEGGKQVYYDDEGNVRLLVHSGALSPDNADEGGVLVQQLAATMQATERTATETLVSGVQVTALSQLDLSALSLQVAANFVEGPAPPPDFGDGPYYGTVRLALYDDCGADSTLIAARTVSISGTGAFSASFADFGGVVMEPGTHSLSVEVSLNTALDVSGTWALNAPPAVLPLAGVSTATEIAADGAALRAGDSYVKVVGEGTTIKAGNYALRVTEAGIEASNDGGGTWSPIFT
jgi:hypothetical protein